MAKTTRRSFTPADRARYVERITADIASGMLASVACKKHGIGKTQFHAWGGIGPRSSKEGGVTTTMDVSMLPKRPEKKKTYNKPHAITAAKRARIMAKIEAKMKRGMNASDASLACGVHPSTYYHWKRKPELLAGVPALVNGHAKLNGHTKMGTIGPVQIALQVSAISISVAGQPVTLTLEHAIRLQEGLDKMLQHR